VFFPNTLDRIERYCLTEKKAVLRIDHGRGGRHGAGHGHDDCRSGDVCVGSFQKNLPKNPYWVSPLSFFCTWLSVNHSICFR